MELPEAINLTDVLWQAAWRLFERTVTRDVLPVRLLGVGVSNLTEEKVVQGYLFDQARRQRQAALDRTIDRIRQQLGHSAIKRGSLQDRDETGEER